MDEDRLRIKLFASTKLESRADGSENIPKTLATLAPDSSGRQQGCARRPQPLQRLPYNGRVRRQATFPPSPTRPADSLTLYSTLNTTVSLNIDLRSGLYNERPWVLSMRDFVFYTY